MGHDRDRRAMWREERRRMEARLTHEKRRSALAGELPASRLEPVTRWADRMLSSLGIRPALAAHARRFVIERHAIVSMALPLELDGYTILHLSDLHVGTVPGLVDAAIRALSGENADLLVLTGDYQTNGTPAAEAVAAEIARLVAPMRLVDGALAVLGNHDDHRMADALERHGIRALVNERLCIRRGAGILQVSGTDDCHAFYTPAAQAVIAAPIEGYSMVLSHTPELADMAAQAGHHLYLCGHTHGGQVCLPGRRPLFTALDSHHELASGRWRRGAMEGYTSRALGSSRPPLRVNCPAEVAVLRLQRCIDPGFP